MEFPRSDCFGSLFDGWSKDGEDIIGKCVTLLDCTVAVAYQAFDCLMSKGKQNNQHHPRDPVVEEKFVHEALQLKLRPDVVERVLHALRVGCFERNEYAIHRVEATLLVTITCRGEHEVDIVDDVGDGLHVVVLRG